MGAAEMMGIVGQQAEYELPNGYLYLNVTVIDVRENFGRIDYKVQPISGRGQVWVNADRVRLKGKAE